jgi:hypothetical protein
MDLAVFAKMLIDPEAIGNAGVREAADRQQKMRADDLRRTCRAIDGDRDPVATAGDAHAFGAESDVNAFLLKDFGDVVGDVLVFSSD